MRLLNPETERESNRHTGQRQRETDKQLDRHKQKGRQTPLPHREADKQTDMQTETEWEIGRSHPPSPRKVILIKCRQDSD